MKYFAVFNSVRKEPDAIFKTERHAESYRNNQRWVWPKVRFTIWEVEIPRSSRKKMVFTKTAKWHEHVRYGLKLLLSNLKHKWQKTHSTSF